jgi:hypothetical protein
VTEDEALETYYAVDKRASGRRMLTECDMFENVRNRLPKGRYYQLLSYWHDTLIRSADRSVLEIRVYLRSKKGR